MIAELLAMLLCQQAGEASPRWEARMQIALAVQAGMTPADVSKTGYTLVLEALRPPSSLPTGWVASKGLLQQAERALILVDRWADESIVDADAGFHRLFDSDVPKAASDPAHQMVLAFTAPGGGSGLWHSWIARWNVLQAKHKANPMGLASAADELAQIAEKDEDSLRSLRLGTKAVVILATEWFQPAVNLTDDQDTYTWRRRVFAAVEQIAKDKQLSEAKEGRDALEKSARDGLTALHRRRIDLKSSERESLELKWCAVSLASCLKEMDNHVERSSASKGEASFLLLLDDERQEVERCVVSLLLKDGEAMKKIALPCGVIMPWLAPGFDVRYEIQFEGRPRIEIAEWGTSLPQARKDSGVGYLQPLEQETSGVFKYSEDRGWTLLDADRWEAD